MTAVPLAEAREVDRFGGKAVELGAAIRNGFSVPDGVALSVELVDAVHAGDPAARAAVIERSGIDRSGAVAVRSSAVGEDSATASFAGQHATKLNVVGAAALIEAVIAVRGSGHTESALAYRKRAGVDARPRVAVVVQRLISAELAGVLFTRDPVSKRDECVVEVARGLGEAVVAGLVNPERIRFSRDGRVLERTAADQDLMIVARPGGGTEERPVADRRAALLGDDHVRALHELAMRCEQVWGSGGHDVEFAFVGPTLYLLQRRSITR